MAVGTAEVLSADAIAGECTAAAVAGGGDRGGGGGVDHSGALYRRKKKDVSAEEPLAPSGRGDASDALPRSLAAKAVSGSMDSEVKGLVFVLRWSPTSVSSSVD